MLLKKVVLHKFKRFFLSGVEHFVYTPDSNITIIAWTNGMGKSSLLSQLNPLPADLKRDYREDGYKYIEYQVGDTEYILSSGYVSKGKHSFLKNGIELNTGGTSTVQKQLVEEHFKLTLPMFNILLGIDNLTTMTPSIRKHWFTMLSPIDYTFPIKVWNNLKSRARDILGSIKVLQEDLVKKTESIVDQEEIKLLREQVDKIDTLIIKLSQQLVTTKEPLSKFKDTSAIEEVFNRYSKYQSIVYEVSTLEDINVETAKIKLGNLEATLEKYNQELDKKSKAIKTLEILNSKDNLDNLTKVIEDYRNTIVEIRKLLPNDIIQGTSDLVANKLQEVTIKSNVILQTLLHPDFTSIGSRKDLLDNQVLVEKLKTEFSNLKGIYSGYVSNIKELEAVTKEHDVTCPNCNHIFHYSNVNQISVLKSKLAPIETELKERFEVIKNLVEKNKMLTTKIENIDKLTQVLSEQMLQPFLEDISTAQPEGVLNLLNKARVLVTAFKDYDTKILELKALEEKLKIQQEASKLAKELGIDSLASLEKDVNDITTARTQVLKSIENVKLYITSEATVRSIVKEIEEYQDYKHNEYKFLLDSKHNELLVKQIGELKLRLSTIQKKITDSDTNNSIVTSLQNTITANKSKLDVLTKMLTVLSPDGGLIAKSINSFLNTYLSEMNTIINSVWSYSMELLPCEVDESNDLNYKFKVKVNHDETIEDVSKLSSSMQEIVNLAFKIIFIKYFHLSGFPLILDEFGRTMDPEHRVNAYDVIDRVLTHNFNQIILVCHFESMYSRFANADFLELKESIDTLTIRS